MQVATAKRYRRTVLLIQGEGVVTLVTRRVPTARDNGIVRGDWSSYQEIGVETISCAESVVRNKKGQAEKGERRRCEAMGGAALPALRHSN